MTVPIKLPPLPPPPEPGLIQRIFGFFQSVWGTKSKLQGEGTTQTGSGVESPRYHEANLIQLRYDREAIINDVRRLMDSDPRMAQSNQDIARDVFGSSGLRVSVKPVEGTPEETVKAAQDIIDELFRRADINGTGPGMVAGLLEDGDLFMSPVVADDRVMRVAVLPTAGMDRNEDTRGQFFDVDQAFRQIDMLSREVIASFALWQVNHIRWDYRPTRGAIYGRTQYMQSRGAGRYLQMTENDLVVRRRARATLPRHHKIGDQNYTLSKPEADEYKRENCPDPATGMVVTDYVTSGKVAIDTVEGGDANLGEIGDVEHINNVYMLRLGRQKGLMGFGEDINRDILEQQQEEYQEFLRGIRHLLWHGDGGIYSGLEDICNFALALAGINPDLITYQPSWPLKLTEKQLEFVKEIDDRRVSGMISHRTTLELVSNTLGLESAEAELLLLEQERTNRQQADETDDLEFAAEQTGAGKGMPKAGRPGAGDGRRTTPQDLEDEGVVE